MSKHLLVVDDQMDIILFIKDRLENLGYTVSTAMNGKEGLEIIESQAIHGLLLDLEMPVMDGLTMIRELQKRLIRIPIIVMSTDPSGFSMAKAIVSGAQDYLFKPISFDMLETKCRQLFD